MNLRKLTRSALANGVSLFVRIVINFVLTPYLVVHLGRGEYGVWMTLVTFTLSGSLSFFSFGFQGALIKYVAEFAAVKKFRALNEVFSATILVYAGAGALCGAGVAVAARFFLTTMFHIPVENVDAARTVMYVFAAMVVVELPGLALSAVVEGTQRYGLLAVLDIGRFTTFAVGAWIVLSRDLGLTGLAVVMLCSTCGYSAALGLAAKRLVPSLGLVWRGDHATRRELYRLTRDLFLIRVNSLVYNNMDKMIIGAALTTTQVTDYDIANRIHGLALTVMGLAPSVVLPASSALDAANDADRQRQLLLQGSKYATAMTIPFVVVLYVLSGELITTWIGPEYAHDALYARAFLSYLLIWPTIQVGWSMLVGVNRVRSIVPLQTASVALNLGLTVVLVQRVGVLGTMLGTVIANLLVVIPYVRLILTTFDVHLREFVRVAILPSAATGIVIAGGLTAAVSARPPGSLVEVGAYLAVVLLAAYVFFFLVFVDRAEKVKFLGVLRRAPEVQV